MSLQEFNASLTQRTPPENLSRSLQVLWWDAKGNWESAHNIAQDIHSPEGSLLHAYLHRKEGDLGNASYWYHRAKRSMPTASLDVEWKNLLEEFLQR